MAAKSNRQQGFQIITVKVKYRISFRKTKSQTLFAIINQHNIKFDVVNMPGSMDPLISFDVFNDHTAWQKISDLVEQDGIVYLHANIFSEDEIRAAQWCRVGLINHVGYPQPENTWLQTRFTYANYDSESGIYSHQVENFRIKKEPNLKNSHFMDLTWPHEMFVRREVFEKFSDGHVKGYEVRDVLIHKTSLPSKSISQIVVPKITQANALLEGHPLSFSGTKNLKYMPYTQGTLRFTSELLAENVDFVLSKEWFGDRNAYREILVSQKVSALILDNHWKGISLEPVQIDSQKQL